MPVLEYRYHNRVATLKKMGLALQLTRVIKVSHKNIMRKSEWPQSFISAIKHVWCILGRSQAKFKFNLFELLPH